MAVDTQRMTTLVQVFDMQKSLEFYCGILGFELLDKAGPVDDIGWVILKLNEVYLMLNTQYEMHERPQNPDLERIKAHGDTCFYFMCADPDDVYGHIILHGIAAERPKIAPYGMKQLYFSDPDGYSVCFQSPAQVINDQISTINGMIYLLPIPAQPFSQFIDQQTNNGVNFTRLRL